MSKNSKTVHFFYSVEAGLTALNTLEKSEFRALFFDAGLPPHVCTSVHSAVDMTNLRVSKKGRDSQPVKLTGSLALAKDPSSKALQRKQKSEKEKVTQAPSEYRALYAW